MDKVKKVKLSKVDGGYRIESSVDGSLGLTSSDPKETTTVVRANQQDGSYKDIVMVSEDKNEK